MNIDDEEEKMEEEEKMGDEEENIQHSSPPKEEKKVSIAQWHPVYKSLHAKNGNEGKSSSSQSTPPSPVKRLGLSSATKQVSASKASSSESTTPKKPISTTPIRRVGLSKSALMKKK